jgi:hypothetical protein
MTLTRERARRGKLITARDNPVHKASRPQGVAPHWSCNAGHLPTTKGLAVAPSIRGCAWRLTFTLIYRKVIWGMRLPFHTLHGTLVIPNPRFMSLACDGKRGIRAMHREGVQ